MKIRRRTINPITTTQKTSAALNANAAQSEPNHRRRPVFVATAATTLVVGGWAGAFGWSGFFGRSYLIVTAFWLLSAGGVLAFAHPTRHRHVAVPCVVVVALVASGVSWQRMTDPGSQLLGGSITHGSRRERLVALTFDDGPNYGSTLQVRDTLDAFGAKGTFFSVGSAVVRAPEITRALIADGHLVANHAETHDSLTWLSPLYRQASTAQTTFAHAVGVCPGFFRPPHGYHTPFMAHAVRGEHLQLVEWDVSAHDWDTTDERLVADRVLAHVRPGSIVLLHDGLDGDPHADRTVVVRALPLILAGLRARDLHPVRLDELLHSSGYQTSCT